MKKPPSVLGCQPNRVRQLKKRFPMTRQYLIFDQSLGCTSMTYQHNTPDLHLQVFLPPPPSCSSFPFSLYYPAKAFAAPASQTLSPLLCCSSRRQSLHTRRKKEEEPSPLGRFDLHAQLVPLDCDVDRMKKLSRTAHRCHRPATQPPGVYTSGHHLLPCTVNRPLGPGPC